MTTAPLTAAFPGIQRVEADGVPVLIAPREGNTTGGIIFRVGSADETLATSGITHLVEHLALQSQVLSDAHVNGQTRPDVTVFHATGSEDEVVRYLNDVCSALRDGLPLDRLETEMEILRSEASLRNPGYVGRMHLERHGAQGYGVRALGERGLDRLTAREVETWATTRFTRQNAIAWFSSDTVPSALDLRLPEGSRMPLPPVTKVLSGTPAFLTGLRDGIAVDAIVRRTGIESVVTGVIEQALHRDLRRDTDIASQIHAEHERLDDDHVRVTITVHAAEGRHEATAGGLTDVLGRLRFHVSDDDLAAARALRLEELAEWAAAPEAAVLPSIAHQTLTGRLVEEPAEVRARIEAATADSVRELIAAIWSEALWFGPRELRSIGATPAPEHSLTRVNGTACPRLDDPSVSLVIGDDGVSLVAGDAAVTVLFSEVALLETVPDGARALTGHDGFRVELEPTLYQGLGPDLIARIDTKVPQDVVVHLPAREADEIPVPRDPGPANRAGRSDLRRRARKVVATIVLVPVTLIAIMVVGIGIGAGIEKLTGTSVPVGVGLAPLAVLAAMSIVRSRHGKEKNQ
ncbi:insulinase family protein [Myceligenerans pegani]|uniref:Insulinase family protein n=1 Tax=Myceligenerans pegani TaxID=2776917 RepID=A0ABR9N5T7_9MICO|nr:insulinase family protein [Myceligenerans sp. TRM 65318]MBE1878725.1 insulinase family protein [Myceligenerans sp. TRM 65318]MBE3020996.1 insulinase family protein [Myceligenerans sp. TRM 65318]